MEKLKRILSRIDGKGYGTYKELYGEFKYPFFTLKFTKIQPDPYAPPSKVVIKIKNKIANFPKETFNSFNKKLALYDFLHRLFHKINKNRNIILPKSKQQILFRSIFKFSENEIKFKLKIQLPAKGRRILGKEAFKILIKDLPQIVQNLLIYENIPKEELEEHIKLVEDQEFIRRKLKEKGLVCFIANNSILPRESGISDKPLKDAVKFVSPESLKVKFTLPSGKEIEGMGIKEGITLICGGGFHGKSTLLEAIQLGVYNHIKDDGREFVITREDAVKIRAEDGRYIEKVDISPFIENLPFGKDTRHFSTEDASGSTSQSANIIEAIEAGSKLLLIDEDTTATNLMIRDLRMQKLVHKDKEPITPFIDRIRELWEKFGISTIMVSGGLGDYFEVADYVIVMENYLPKDKTKEAKQIIQNFPSKRIKETSEPFKIPKPRFVISETINPHKGEKIKIDAKSKDTLIFGKNLIDLSAVEQIVDRLQVKTAGEILWFAVKNYAEYPIKEMIEKALNDTIKNEFENLRNPDSCDYTYVRKYEIISALNRLRSLKVKIKS